MESKSGTRSCEQKQGDWRKNRTHQAQKSQGEIFPKVRMLIDYFFSSSCFSEFYTYTLMSSWWFPTIKNILLTPSPQTLLFPTISIPDWLCVSVD